jgi:sugar lactone lactonase YvrE
MKIISRIGLTFLLLSAANLDCFAQSGIITTYAGNGGPGFSGDGGQAKAAQMGMPNGVVTDSAGNLYIADSRNNRIRKITPAGIISTVAGNGTQGFSGDGGSALAAQFGSIYDMAVDAAGNLYVADMINNRIRKITPAGIISTVAGNGTQGFSGDGGPALAAQLYYPFGVAVDSAGNLYFSDINNNRVRKVTPAGIISTVAGIGTQGWGGDGGPATAARLIGPSGLALDSSGNLYIAEIGGNCIRKVTVDGLISTVAGNGMKGFGGDGGPATNAQMYQPRGVAVDSAFNIYIADSFNSRVRKVTPSGVITTVAGNGTAGFSGDGGLATATQISQPHDVAVDSAGYLYIADADNNRIRRVSDMLFFPQVAVGGGYTTIFTVTNTGATVATGILRLTGKMGEPFVVKAAVIDSSGVTQPSFSGSAFPLTIPSGGTVFLSAVGLTASSLVQTGWGQLESAGGSLSAVASYENVVAGIMQTTVGILHSQIVPYATMPVDNDSTHGKEIVYAIANPGSQAISIKLALVGQDGVVVDDRMTVTLGPGEQRASYFWQDLGRALFKGSLVLRGQGGATFIVLGLLYKQNLLTAIPVILGKAPGIPD